ncbi:MAG: hypothetical protein K6G12_05955 [Lachnospiraceae bacterium]|nr:hypothetical protein [Lachnospiraceae bacterium]
MTFEAYTNPDFGWMEKLIFLFATFVGIALIIVFILIFTRVSVASLPRRERRVEFYERSHNRIQRFYEMIIAGTSVMSFSCTYVIINHIYNLVLGGETPGPVLAVIINAWESGRDFVLLLLICLSCVLNSILDRLLIPLKHLEKSEKATIRMLAMFYVILILIYLDHIGDASEYNPVMMYYLGLMVGRFVYFDASFGDFLGALKNMFRNLHLLLFGLALTGALCWFGFGTGYLLERNYYIVGAFYTHLFMLVVIFIIYHTHILDLLVRKPAGYDPGGLAGENSGANQGSRGGMGRNSASSGNDDGGYSDYREYKERLSDREEEYDDDEYDYDDDGYEYDDDGYEYDDDGYDYDDGGSGEERSYDPDEYYD